MCKILYHDVETKNILHVNLDDFGRIRTFIRHKFTDWNDDPIPIDIANSKLGLSCRNSLDVQMIEVGKCNLHCWWCYLPDIIRTVHEKYMKWFTASELLDLILRDNSECRCIYISGGNPELVPELIFDFMKELKKRNLDHKILLWSDDVLTTDYLFHLDASKLNYMIKYKNYAKVCCLKGFDDDSFSFNTLLPKECFYQQLERLKKYIYLGFDVYVYIVFTCAQVDDVDKKIDSLIQKLQSIHYYLPLRVVPIKIEEFTAVTGRLNQERKKSLKNQFKVLEVWNKKIEMIYSDYCDKNITSINLTNV